MNQNEKDTLSQIVTKEGKTFTAFLNAVKEARATKDDRQNKAAEAVATYTQKIEKLQAKNAELSDDLTDAILDGDESRAHQLRGEISVIENEIRDTRSNIKILEKHNAAETDAERKRLVLVAVEQYKAARTARCLALEKLQAAETGLKREIEFLKNDIAEIAGSKKRIEPHCSGSALIYPSSEELELIAMYEKAFGAIDVTGHAAGSDSTAKLRFLSGNFDGIEFTPVIGGKIKQTAAPENREPEKIEPVKRKVTAPKEFFDGEMRNSGLHIVGEEGNE